MVTKKTIENKLNPDYSAYGAALLLLFLTYRHTLGWLLTSWLENSDYSHGFAIPLISGYIVWQKREKLRKYRPASSPWGLAIIAAGLLLQIASVRMDVNFTSAYSFVMIMLGVILYWWGREITKELLFPVFFLIFMIPVPTFILDPLSFRLKLLSSYLSAELLRLMGISLYRDGVILSVARGTLEVADPCSGIRSLMTFLMMGTVFAYFANGTSAKKTTLFAITVPLVIMGNTIRIVTAVLLLHFYGFIISNTEWETALGVAVVALTAALLLFIGKLMKCQITDFSA